MLSAPELDAIPLADAQEKTRQLLPPSPFVAANLL